MELITVQVTELPEILAEVGGLFQVVLFICFILTAWALSKYYMELQVELCQEQGESAQEVEERIRRRLSIKEIYHLTDKVEQQSSEI